MKALYKLSPLFANSIITLKYKIIPLDQREEHKTEKEREGFS